MNKKIGAISIVLFATAWMTGSLFSNVFQKQGQIKRLTYSGNGSVHYPCLCDDGKEMLYVLETDSGEEVTRSIRLMSLDSGKEIELFKDRNRTAPEPYEDTALLIGSKPPLLSGDGRFAFFVLSLDQPENILDHYLAMINTDGSGLEIFSFPMDTLQGIDWKSSDFKGDEWERISYYAANRDGSRVACVMKGHLGPARYGNAGAIVVIDTRSGEKRTILAPEFNGKGWDWDGYPSHPLLGGGWAFGMNGPGDKILFGGRSSDDETDYDLYLTDHTGGEFKRLTDFHDRWFSLAELSQDGKNVVFCYTGKKKQGIGTYIVSTEGQNLSYLQSADSQRIEFCDLTGNGKVVLYKRIYDGEFFDLETGDEGVLFNKDTPGFISALVPMDFPQFPAFWGPRIASRDGRRILLAGFPEGKISPEFFLLSFEKQQ